MKYFGSEGRNRFPARQVHFGAKEREHLGRPFPSFHNTFQHTWTMLSHRLYTLLTICLLSESICGFLIISFLCFETADFWRVCVFITTLFFGVSQRLPADIQWEEDPNTFIFHNEKDGKIKMHVFPLELDDWIRIDATYPEQLRQRLDLLTDRRDDVFVTTCTESTRRCEQELFELLYDYLPSRFPSIFEKRSKGIYNRVTKEFIPEESEENPIIRASRLTQEDWCIMEWSDIDQGYVLTSGVVCFPQRWSLREKHGMVMGAVHKPVHAFTKHLKSRSYDLMRKMKVNRPLWRANWGRFGVVWKP